MSSLTLSKYVMMRIMEAMKYMIKKNRISAWLLFAILIILSVGCTGNADNAEPTVDSQALFTAAAMTVQAEFTEIAALTPSATATLPPTPTRVTSVPTLVTPAVGIPTLPGVGTALPGIGTQPTLPGLATTAGTGCSTGDKAEWLYNTPVDGKTVQRTADFDLIWYVKNVGTTTWTKDYIYRWAGYGPNFATKSQYNFWWEDGIAPGETAEFIVHMIAPNTVGKTETMYWVLTNPAGCNFRLLDYYFNTD